jgi:hypothetical protein
MTESFSVALVMPTTSKYITNNNQICDSACEVKKEEPEIVEEDSSSNTTSVNGAEIHIHHFDPWMHT